MPSEYLELADWRRAVHALYAGVRDRWQADPEAAHRRWREGRDRLLAAHSQSPLEPASQAGFQGLRYHAYDPALSFVAEVEPAAEERFPIATSRDGAMAFVRFGSVRLPLGTLDVYWLDTYGGGVFLPFRDATSGRTTYGGGRYLLDTAKGADLGVTPGGALVLDFNFAYHPSCHYHQAWDCPLAPPGNRLEGAVQAGELAFA